MSAPSRFAETWPEFPAATTQVRLKTSEEVEADVDDEAITLRMIAVAEEAIDVCTNPSRRPPVLELQPEEDES